MKINRIFGMYQHMRPLISVAHGHGVVEYIIKINLYRIVIQIVRTTTSKVLQ